MKIKVLGSGCANCSTLERNVKTALQQTGIVAEVLKITDPIEILSYGVSSTPALVIEDKVVSAGRILAPSSIVPLLGSD